MSWKSSQLSDSQKQLRVGRRSACRPVHSKSLSKCGGKSSLPWGQGKGPRMWTLGLLRLPCAADVARPLWEKACENMYPHVPNWCSEIQASIVSDKFIEEVTLLVVNAIGLDVNKISVRCNCNDEWDSTYLEKSTFDWRSLSASMNSWRFFIKSSWIRALVSSRLLLLADDINLQWW